MPVLSNIEFRALNRGRQEGRQEGILLNSRESILEILETRFGELPHDLQNAINQIEDISQLKTLIKQAITVASVSDFQRLLN